MNFDNDEDALEFINRLLERLHQADFTNHGSKIEFVYVASGGQHVETQVIAYPHPNLTPDPDLTPDPSPKGEGSFKGEGSSKGEGKPLPSPPQKGRE